ncbi:MAG TPA: GEVED domain-containing protein, partial [Flavobacteriales bacterium]|nr:GEVED domain-containing protein [Flavobacteriales bacterium]
TLFPATTTLAAGSTYTITLSPGTYTINDLAAWIDFNQDGVFDNVTEKLGQTLNMGASPATTSYSFTVPAGALNGTTRLRVREADQGSTIMDPCTGYTYGETEDYNITITGGFDQFTYAWTELPAMGTLTSTTTNPTTATGLTVDETYSVTVTSLAGCTATGSVTATVGAPLVCGPLTATPTICSGQNFNVSVSPTGGGAPYSYSWSDGVGGVYTNNDTITANLAAGTYTFTVTVTDACAGTCTSNITVIVDPTPATTVTPTAASICNPGGSPVTITASGATAYTWSPATGLSGTTSATVTANPSSTTTYTVTGTTGSCSSTATVTISVGSVVTLSSVTATPATVCVGAGTTLTATATLPTSPYCTPTYSTGTGFGDYISVVNVNTLNNATAGSPAPYYTLYATPTTSLAAGTTYTITLTPGTYTINDLAAWIDFNQDGVFDNTTEKLGQTLNMGAAPATTSYSFTVPATALSGTTRLRVREADQGSTIMDPCTGYTYGETEDYTITITGGLSLFTYSWSESPASGTLTSTTTNPTTASGLTVDQTYTVTVTSFAGCTATGSVNVTVGAPLTCTGITAAPACSGSNFTLIAGTTGGGSPYSYTWSDGVGGIYTNNDTITANLAAGTYTFTVTVTDACGGSCTSSQTVTVNASPAVSVTPTTGNICNPGGTPVTLTASGALTYAWSPAAGLSATTGATVTANPSLYTTTYTVTGTDAIGCTGTATATINVSTYPVVSVTATPDVVCPGGSTALAGTISYAAAPHCIPTYSTGTGFGDYISVVNVNTLNNATAGSPAPYYTLYATPTTSLAAGTTYTITLTPGTYTSNDLAAWIDYNQDGVFDNVNEKLGQTLNMAATPATTSYTFTIPAGAYNGTTLLRVREADQGSTVMDPCTGYTYGETEDYEITITGGVAPYTFAWSESPANSTLTSTTTNPTTAAGITVNETYTLTATSNAGCVSTANVVVNIDNIAPTITCAADVTVNADAGLCSASGVALGTPTTTDNCTVASVTNDAPATFAVGTTTVTWTATDGNGNSATCAQLVTVTDNQLPVITCPATATLTTDAGMCTSTGAIGTATALDNCGVLAVTNDAPASFPLGTTVVTWTATDVNGNTATCTQNVIVTDNQNPTITCPASVNAFADAGMCTASSVALGTPTTTDNCTVASVTNDAPAIFALGTTVVTWTVTDGGGNTATCTQTVIVSDNQSPVITCPANVTANADASSCAATGVALGTPTVTDNCGVSSVTNDAPLSYPVGTTTVTWTALDVNGNISTCAQLVTVIDNQMPSITCAGAVVVNADAGLCSASGVSLGTPTTSDNCTVSSVTNDAPATFAIGTTTVTWTATDASGNTATCTQTVTVMDAQAPTITCPSNVSVNADAGLCSASGVTLGTPITADNCGVLSTTNDAPATYPLGITTVTWTVTDVNGNVSNCTQTVTVTDNQAPVVSACPADITINATNPGCTAIATWTPPTGTDNCLATVTPTSTHNSGDAFSAGTTVVTYTFDDGNGNTSTCTFNVTVVNTLTASATATDALCNGAASGNIDLTIGGGTPGYTFDWDNDGTGDTDDTEDITVGAGTYNVIVTDAIGCTTTTTATVNEPAAISLTAVSTNPTCFGGSDGSIDLTVSGGTGPYLFDWNNDGTGDTDDTEDVSGLDAGANLVIVLDANGCSTNAVFTLTNPAPITTTAVITPDGCSGPSTGGIDITPAGGTAPYTYSWSNGALTEDISSVAAGTYVVTVTDVNGCFISSGFEIGTAAPNNVTFTFTLCAGQSFTVGSNTYNSTGTYIDTLTSAGGCDSIITTNLTVNPPVDVSTTTASTTITANSTNATAYQWVNCEAGMAPMSGETNASFTATSNGNYAVIVFESGCPDTSACVNITGVGIDDLTALQFELYPNPNNGEFTIAVKDAGRISITNSIGQVIYTTTLVPGKNQLAVGNIARGTYNVTIVNNDGLLTGTKRMVIMQ